MGLSIEFYAGDGTAIGRAFTEYELEGLRDGTVAHAYVDFSLHISVEDLDVLSEQVAGLLHREPPIHLLDHLSSQVGGTEDESSAHIVDRAWVELIASVSPESAAELSVLWLSAVMCETSEEIDVHSEAPAQAVGELVALCRQALDRGTDVVFAWYL